MLEPIFRRLKINSLLLANAMLCLSGCHQSAPPMPRETFLAAAGRCSLHSTTYTSRHGILLDEPLIDFTKEPDGKRAQLCFNKALEQIDLEKLSHGVTGTGYIWEWRG
jgi:hypothetical protein